MRVLVVGDRGHIGAVMVSLLRAAGHQVGGQDVAWRATVASASMDRTLRVAALLRPTAYPCEPESVR